MVGRHLPRRGSRLRAEHRVRGHVERLGLQLRERILCRKSSFGGDADLPLWLSISLGAAAAVASTDRALRMRYRWWLDAAGN